MTYDDQFDAIRQEERAKLEARLLSRESIEAAVQAWHESPGLLDDQVRAGIAALFHIALASHPTPDTSASPVLGDEERLEQKGVEAFLARVDPERLDAGGTGYLHWLAQGEKRDG